MLTQNLFLLGLSDDFGGNVLAQYERTCPGGHSVLGCFSEVARATAEELINANNRCPTLD